MADWRRTSGWADLLPAGRCGRRDGAAGVRIGLIEPAALTTIIARQGRADELSRRLEGRLGCALPQSGHVTSGPRGDIVWTAPSQWLMVDRHEAACDLAEACADLAATMDQTSSRALLEISGPAARDALAKGFAIDLDPGVFPPGRTAVTALAHMSVQIWLADAEPRFVVAVPRSFAGSFWSWLAGAAAAYGYEVEAA